MWNLIKMALGQNPVDAKIKCPICSYVDTFKNYASWEERGVRGLRGKLESGHIVLTCYRCRGEIVYDTISGKTKIGNVNGIRGSSSSWAPSGNKIYYYEIINKRHGPVSIEDLWKLFADKIIYNDTEVYDCVNNKWKTIWEMDIFMR